MIARACYVICDKCGDPAEVSTEGAEVARAMARAQGFTRVTVIEPNNIRRRDLCSRCSAAEEKR